MSSYAAQRERITQLVGHTVLAAPLQIGTPCSACPSDGPPVLCRLGMNYYLVLSVDKGVTYYRELWGAHEYKSTRVEFEPVYQPDPMQLACLMAASMAHANQTRKHSGRPYIAHPIEVAEIIRGCAPVDETSGIAICAALLHDVIEDTDQTPETLAAEGIPAEVISVILEVTDKGATHRERKTRQITTAPGKTRAAKLVKLADKLHNSTDLKNEFLRGVIPMNVLQRSLAHSAAVVDGMRGTCEAIESQLDALFAMLPADPAARATLLEAYLSR